MSDKFKNIGANTILYTIGDLLTIGVSGFLLIPVYLRYMTPAEYGIWGIVTTTTMLVGVVACMGAHSSVGRFYFIYREKGAEFSYLGSIWLFQTLFSLVILGVLALLGETAWLRLSPEVPYKPYFWFVAIGAFLTFSSGIYPIWLRVQEKAKEFVVFQIINTSLLLIFIWFFLIKMNASVLGALCAVLGTNICMAIVSVIRLRLCFSKWNFKFKYIKESAIFGFSMMLGAFGYYFLNRSQFFVLQQYSDLSAVGIFSLALQLGGILIVVSNSFGKAWQPMIYASKTKEIASEVISQTTKYFLAVMLYLTIAIIVFSREILQLLARPEFYETRYVMCVIAVASFFYILTSLSSSALLYEKRAGTVQIAIWIIAAINLMLSLIIVPKLKAIGSAYAMLISFFLYATIIHFQAQRVLKVRYNWRNIFKILFTGIAVVLLDWLSSFILSNSAILFKIVLMLSYPFVLITLGVFTKKELTALFSSISRDVRTLYFSIQKLCR